MNIAFINQPSTPAGPPRGCDSIAIWSYQVARRLAPHHAVAFYGNASAHPNPIESEGIVFRPLTARGDRLRRTLRIFDRWRLSPARRPIFASPLFHRGYAQAAARDLRGVGCDVVHIHNYSQFVPQIRAALPHARIVLPMHCEWLSQLDPKKVAPRLAAADWVLGCSDYVTGKIQARFPQFAERCRTVPNGVDAERFAPGEASADEAPRLLYVGRISPEKGVHVLLDAFALIAAEFPTVRLDLVGPAAMAPRELIVRLSDDPLVQGLGRFYPGSYLDQLRRRMPPALAERVVFHGDLPQEQLADYYRQADVLINPALSEAFGMSLVEGMSAGAAVVAARTGGMVEVVADGAAGLLVAPDDPAALAAGLRRLLVDRELRRRLGRAGRERVLANYSWDCVAARLLEQYATIAPPRPAPPRRSSLAPHAVVRRAYHARLRRRRCEMDGEQLRRSAIVFAPHPDDETLGCGGTILRKVAAGAEVRLVFLTDGGGSHAPSMPREELRALRIREALAAAEALGVAADRVAFLDYPDGALTAHVPDAATRIAELLAEHRPAEVFLPYDREAPRDHLAANHAVHQALRVCGSPAQAWEYPIWYWRHWPQISLSGSWRQRLSLARSSLQAQLGRGLLTDFRHACYIGDVLDQKRAALAQHRSQMERHGGDPRWPTLGDVSNGEFLECFFQDWEWFAAQ